MARVFKGSHLHTPRSSANGMNHTCLCLPGQSWYSFTDPEEMEGWVGLGAECLKHWCIVCLSDCSPFLWQIYLHAKSSSITEMAAQCCTSRIFAFEWGTYLIRRKWSGIV